MKFMLVLFSSLLSLYLFDSTQAKSFQLHNRNIFNVPSNIRRFRFQRILPALVKREMTLLSLWAGDDMEKATPQDYRMAHHLLTHQAPMDQVVALFVDNPIKRKKITRLLIIARRIITNRLMQQNYRLPTTFSKQLINRRHQTGKFDVAKEKENKSKQLGRKLSNSLVDDEDYVKPDSNQKEMSGSGENDLEESGSGESGSGDNTFDDTEVTAKTSEVSYQFDVSTGKTKISAKPSENVAETNFDLENNENDSKNDEASGKDKDDKKIVTSTTVATELWNDDEDLAPAKESSGDDIDDYSGSRDPADYSGTESYEIITVKRIKTADIPSTTEPIKYYEEEKDSFDVKKEENEIEHEFKIEETSFDDYDENPSNELNSDKMELDEIKEVENDFDIITPEIHEVVEDKNEKEEEFDYYNYDPEE